MSVIGLLNLVRAVITDLTINRVISREPLNRSQKQNKDSRDNVRVKDIVQKHLAGRHVTCTALLGDRREFWA
jgi:hypothetical protein